MEIPLGLDVAQRESCRLGSSTDGVRIPDRRNLDVIRMRPPHVAYALSWIARRRACRPSASPHRCRQTGIDRTIPEMHARAFWGLLSADPFAALRGNSHHRATTKPGRTGVTAHTARESLGYGDRARLPPASAA